MVHTSVSGTGELLLALKQFTNKGLNIIGYGAPAKATTLLNYLNLNSDSIKNIIEDNPLKFEKFVPGTGIKIISKEKLSYVPDVVIVLAWNYYDSIVAKNQDLIEGGGEFISIKSLFESS